MVTEIESLGTLKQYTTLHKNQNHPLPRLSAWYGPIDYAYSGVVMKGNPVSDSPLVVAAYHHLANNVLDPNNIAITADCFLVNQYRTGRDSCGEHSDDEPEVDRFSPIITLSLGQQRFMLIRELGKHGNAIAVKLEPGSVLVMNGDNFQGKYTHQIPKVTVCNSSRTSITFRTCNHDYLSSRNALSTPLMAIQSAQPVFSALKGQQAITSSPTPLQDSKRRQSLSFSSFSLSGAKFETSSDISSPTTPLSPLPGNISENSSKVSSKGEFLPLSLEVMCEAIDVIKDRSVKLELSRYSLSTSGSVTDCRKRLKKAVKTSFQKLASNLHRSVTPDQPEPNIISNAIEIFEKSIIDLQAKISTQNSVLQTLVLCNDDKKSKASQKDANAIPKEISNFDKRLEKIEELISSIKEEQTETMNMFNKLEANVDKIQSNTNETKERVRTSLQPIKSKPQRTRSDRSAPNQPQIKSQSARPRRKRKVLILHDSQLNAFEPHSFSQAFDVEKFKAGSYTDLASKHIRQVISKPSIDAYVLQLGVNDYRYQTSQASLDKAVEDTKTCINKLLSSSTAKVVVTLPTPTPSEGICDLTRDYVKLITEFITSTRQSDNNWRRLYTVNNLASFNHALEKLNSSPDSPDPLKPDKLHVSEYGLKKLSLNIKYGLYRSFGLNLPRRQAPVGP
ncbi:hypothetical protein ACHWQZ_G008545 [Mnemiopsis leidyi]